MHVGFIDNTSDNKTKYVCFFHVRKKKVLNKKGASFKFMLTTLTQSFMFDS